MDHPLAGFSRIRIRANPREPVLIYPRTTECLKNAISVRVAARLVGHSIKDPLLTKWVWRKPVSECVDRLQHQGPTSDEVGMEKLGVAARLLGHSIGEPLLTKRIGRIQGRAQRVFYAMPSATPESPSLRLCIIRVYFRSRAILAFFRLAASLALADPVLNVLANILTKLLDLAC